jgi:uridine kinase
MARPANIQKSTPGTGRSHVSESSAPVAPSRPRRTARITLGGKVYSAPVGTPLEVYLRSVYPELIPPVRPSGQSDTPGTAVAAIVDGKLRELSYPVLRDAEVRPVMMSDGDGMRIYRRSLSFLLVVAAHELFPERKLTIDHALPFGGFYCMVAEGKPFSPDELARLKAQMDSIVAEDSPITKAPMPLDEAIAMFRTRGDDDKLRLLESRQKDYLVIYTLRGVQDYFYGYMVPSTGYLTVFNLTPDGEGFILRYPRRHEPDKLQPISALPKLRAVFNQTGRWLDLLGVEDVGRLNQAIHGGRARELVLVAEALHESNIAEIAHTILDRQPSVRLVLIAGPSSSGKTTFSKRLAVQLMAHGLKPFTLGMDNYFVNREDTPCDENGEYDYEHLHTVDLELFNAQLLALIDGQEVQLPTFDFVTGRRGWGDRVQMTAEHVIIVEGIHGMNPELVRDFPRERTFRVYVSALTQLNIDRYNRIPTTDTRLLRRLVRDAAFRGFSAIETLGRWESVRRGEKRWVFPYQENADVMFNSALVYELAVLRPMTEPLLLQIEPGTPRHIEAKRLLSFLSWVEPCPPDLVPDNSLLREFIGGSILHDYVPGRPMVG